MSLSKYFQKRKWERLAKKNANYYILLNKTISKSEVSYRRSGRQDVARFILEDERLKEFLEDSRSKTCLEFGCGNGRMTEFLVEVFGRVLALDISGEMIGRAKNRLAKIKNITYLVNSSEKITLANGSVDFIFSYLVLQHLPTKKMVRRVLAEFYRILKRGGMAKFQLRGRPAQGGIFRFIRWYYGTFFEKKEILKILSEIGFSVLDIYGTGTKLMWLLIQK